MTKLTAAAAAKARADRRDPCADHCPQELDHEKYFARGLPTPCGCKPFKK